MTQTSCHTQVCVCPLPLFHSSAFWWGLPDNGPSWPFSLLAVAKVTRAKQTSVFMAAGFSVAWSLWTVGALLRGNQSQAKVSGPGRPDYPDNDPDRLDRDFLALAKPTCSMTTTISRSPSTVLELGV